MVLFTFNFDNNFLQNDNLILKTGVQKSKEKII